MKHIIVFFAFRNLDDIRLSFESSYLDTIDYLVVENKSEFSDEIEKYFFTKKLKGYIQFEKNIASNAMSIFVRDYYTFLSGYDIITLTDGDLYFYDIRSTLNEIIENLEYPRAMISSATLYLGNAYTLPTRVIGIDHYSWAMLKNKQPLGPVVGNTAHNLVTLKPKNLPILRDIIYQDSHINTSVNKAGGLWIRTNRNQAYHLTWDKYIPGNEYYEWKLKVYPGIWQIKDVCPYRKIVNINKEKNHILVFFAFRNIDDIKTSFDSLYLDSLDYFVVENKSENSEEIEKYFSTKRLKGYIQFERNIAGNALSIFVKDFHNLLCEYDFITLTDGDVYVSDIRSALDEIIKNLDYHKAVVSSISLYTANAQNTPIVGLEHFRWAMLKRREQPGPIVTPTISHSLVTIRKKDIHVLDSERYQDIYILEEVKKMGGSWIRTNRNLAYHLTWDRYVPGNEYYEWKLKVYPGIWEKTESCPYRKIV